MKVKFQKLFGGSASAERIRMAIATFERSLTTPGSRFDRYLQGEQGVLTAEELEGYKLFKNYGCSSCHQGRAVGGNMFEKLGIVRPYFTDQSKITKADLGRFNVTGMDEHKFEFKVPSLRNIFLTDPYLHDGSAKTLKKAIKIMGRYQIGREISSQHIKLITSFLETLTGQHAELTELP
jgi:cytochrome c peroxidase